MFLQTTTAECRTGKLTTENSPLLWKFQIFCSSIYQPIKYHLICAIVSIDIIRKICFYINSNEQQSNSRLPEPIAEIYLTSIWKCGSADIIEGRGRQRKSFKRGGWLTLLGFFQAFCCTSACGTVHACLYEFLWWEKRSLLEVPHSRENLTRLT